MTITYLPAIRWLFDGAAGAEAGATGENSRVLPGFVAIYGNCVR